MNTPPDNSPVRPTAGLAVARLDSQTAGQSETPVAQPFGHPLTQSSDRSQAIRRLIWLYFWLLLFEGALRKWVVPQFASLLLIVRDPVLLLCYAEAVRKGRFPGNGFIVSITVLGGLSFLISLGQIELGAIPSTVAVTIYGLRANFLHLPLIFLIAETFDRRNVEAIGKWLLVLAAPMAVLVFVQYKAPPDAWINLGAGKGAEQIGVALSGIDKIRPAGLFSYHTGLTSYLSLLAAFIFYDFLQEKVYSRTLLIIGVASMVMMVPLSVSRTTFIAVTLVCAGAVLCGMLRPVLLRKSLKIAAVAAFAWLTFGSLLVLKEGMSILTARFEEAEGLKIGIADRYLSGFTDAVDAAAAAPAFGKGLGMGTNAAAGLLFGRQAFLLAEGEWARVVLEMGAVLGFSYIGLRLLLVVKIGRSAFARLETLDTLPILLFSATGLLLLNGQFGQPMTLGFAVFGSGLCLAAATADKQLRRDVEKEPASDGNKPVLAKGRSAYAERLHGG